jgi:ribosomal protein S14
MSQTCPQCGRPYGMIRHYVWTIGFCSRKCRNQFYRLNEGFYHWLTKFFSK